VAEWVIDTNVLLVATRAQLGRAPRRLAARGEDVPVADPEAQAKVFEWLKTLRQDRDEVVVDLPHDLIKAEYARKLDKDEYGRMVIADLMSRGRCKFVEVEVDENEHALVLHDAGSEVTDLEDRKMVAAALESGAPIANACDTDWMDLEARGTLERLGISVVHVIEAWCRAEWKRKSTP
jgi:hypothetical protein